jgi:hypothetical protein
MPIGINLRESDWKSRYTNQVRLRGLMKNKVFETCVGSFVCVAAVSTAQSLLS